MSVRIECYSRDVDGSWRLAYAQSMCQLTLKVYSQMVPRIGIRSMRENIHKSLAAVLSSLFFHNPPTSHVVLDPECGGSHKIQLFSPGPNSRTTNYLLAPCCHHSRWRNPLDPGNRGPFLGALDSNGFGASPRQVVSKSVKCIFCRCNGCFCQTALR